MFTTLTEPAIRRLPGTWVVRAAGAVLGETDAALELTEANGLVQVFFPEADLALAFFERNARRAPSAFSESVQYFDIIASNGAMTDAAWVHEAPVGRAERLAGHIAFDTMRVAVERI
ncbi:DUF427 domain-containing protein [Frigidibacter sp. MR17.24]|uniref:DUF427 domain-containing protein n=1 Tax=Frigidibacter sp. MR17.24 TaxID=3127345 RepID=UPI003012DBC4